METDAQLVARALAGSQDAFRELVLRFERPVYSLIARMVQDPATAEDLAQEAFVKAYRSLRHLRRLAQAVELALQDRPQYDHRPSAAACS